MALTPGLRPFSEDTPTGGRRLGGRVAVDDRGPRMPTLKPTASPVDTYARPARAPIDNDLENLAKGLASLNPALQQYAAVSQEDQATQEDTVAKKWAAAKTHEERQALLKDPEVQGKFAQAYLGKLQATTTGDADQTELFRLYNEEVNKNGSVPDINKFVDDFVARRVQELGGTGAASGYLERMVGVKKSLVDHHQKLLTEKTLTDQQQTATDGILSSVRNVIDLGASDLQAVQSVKEIMKTNKDLLNKPYKEQQAWVLSAVSSLIQDMERNPDKRGKIYSVIETLLDGPRPGEDGVMRRLTEAGDGVGAKAQEILTQAKRQLYTLNNQHGYKTEADLRNAANYDPQNLSDEAIKKAVEDKVISPDAAAGLYTAKEAAIRRMEAANAELEAERVAGQAQEFAVTQAYNKLLKGELNGDVDPVEVPTKEGILKGTGETKKVSSDDLKEKVHTTVQNQLRAEKDYLLSKKHDPKDVDQLIAQKEMNLYAANGMAPPAWKREMKAARVSITTAVSTAKALPRETLQAFEKYQTIKNQHPNLLRDVVDDDTRTFFDVADVAMQEGYADAESALSVAGSYFAKRDDKVMNAEAVSRKEIMSQLSDTEESSWLGVRKLVFGEPLENPSALAPRIAEQASIYVQAFKMKPEAAIEEATKNVRKHVAVVNGWAIDTNSKKLGVDFERRAEKYLEWVYETNKDRLKEYGVSDRRDLTLSQLANSDNFHVITKTGKLVPQMDLDLGGERADARFLTPAYLNKVGEILRAKDVEKAVNPAYNNPRVRLRNETRKALGMPEEKSYEERKYENKK